MDPLLQREFGELVAEAVGDGVGVVLSSHVLSELEGLADRVAVLRDGECVAFESTDELRARARRTIRLEMASRDEAQSLARDLHEMDDVEVEDAHLTVSYAGSVDSIIKAAARYSTHSIEKLGGDLDDVLLDFYSDAGSS